MNISNDKNIWQFELFQSCASDGTAIMRSDLKWTDCVNRYFVNFY